MIWFLLFLAVLGFAWFMFVPGTGWDETRRVANRAGNPRNNAGGYTGTGVRLDALTNAANPGTAMTSPADVPFPTMTGATDPGFAGMTGGADTRFTGITGAADPDATGMTGAEGTGFRAAADGGGRQPGEPADAGMDPDTLGVHVANWASAPPDEWGRSPAGQPADPD